MIFPLHCLGCCFYTVWPRYLVLVFVQKRIQIYRKLFACTYTSDFTKMFFHWLNYIYTSTSACIKLIKFSWWRFFVCHFWNITFMFDQYMYSPILNKSITILGTFIVQNEKPLRCKISMWLNKWSECIVV